MQRLVSLTEPIHRVSRGLAYLAAIATLLMVLVGAYNALARFFGKYLGMALTSNALVELQWYLFSLVFLLGAPWAIRQATHVRVDVIYERLSPRKRAWINLAGAVVLLVPFAAMGLWTSWDFALDSIAAREGSNDPGGLPRWPIKALVPAVFSVLLLQALAEIIHQSAFLWGSGTDPEQRPEVIQR